MLEFIILILVIFLIWAIPVLINNYLLKINSKNSQTTFSGKLNKTLLTNNEYRFYIKLKDITDKYGLLLFTKVRLADIISTTNYSDFNKIRSKHVDFVICNKKTEFVKFIELDDYSHTRKKSYKNDYVKNEVFKNFDIEIFRVKLNEEKTKLEELDNILKEIK